MSVEAMLSHSFVLANMRGSLMTRTNPWIEHSSTTIACANIPDWALNFIAKLQYWKFFYSFRKWNNDFQFHFAFDAAIKMNNEWNTRHFHEDNAARVYLMNLLDVTPNKYSQASNQRDCNFKDNSGFHIIIEAYILLEICPGAVKEWKVSSRTFAAYKSIIHKHFSNTCNYEPWCELMFPIWQGNSRKYEWLSETFGSNTIWQPLRQNTGEKFRSCICAWGPFRTNLDLSVCLVWTNN